MKTDLIEIANSPAYELELNKRNCSALASRLTSAVEEGEVSALDSLAKLTFLSKCIEEALKKIRSIALTEAEKYGQKTFTDFGGIEFSVRETGVKYDFSNDSDWNMYQEQIDALRVEQKAQELVLKSNGKCAKSSTTAVVVNLPK